MEDGIVLERYFVFEGPDGSGKSTQIELAADWLRAKGHEVLITCEPGGTESCNKIRDILLDPDLPLTALAAMFLFMGNRAEIMETVIEPACSDGKYVLSDRDALSTFAYQGYGHGVSLDHIQQLRKIALHDRIPEQWFLIDVPIEVMRARLKKDGEKLERFEKEGPEFFARVHQCYLDFAKRNPEQVSMFSGVGSIDEIHQQIIVRIEDFLE